MSFKLINLATSELVERAVYDDGKRAAKVAARLSALTGRRYQVRKAADGDANWREREVARFESGEYISLAPALQLVMPPDFFGHVAKKAPDLIAYTKSDEKGRHDKRSLLTISAFIDACLAHPFMIEQHINVANYNGYTLDGYRNANFGEAWRSETIRKQRDYAISINNPVKFVGPLPAEHTADDVTRIADEIEHIYTNYDESINALAVSCMRFTSSHYNSVVDRKRVHPVRAYASPDLAIAYMTDTSGVTIGRALCWPERKIYSRVYAEGEAFHAAMRLLGYRKAGYYGDASPEASFAGARLTRIETDNGNFVVPYIDGSRKRLDDNGDWLTLYGAQIEGEITNGVGHLLNGRRRSDDEDDQFICEHCDDECDPDTTTTVYLNSSRTRSEEWCSHCLDSDAFYCHGYEDWFCNNQVDYTIVNDETYSTRYVENNASYCDYYEEYTFDSTNEVTIDDCGNTQRWCESAVSEHAFCYDGTYYSNNLDHVKVVTERYVTKFNRRWATHRGYMYELVNVWYTDSIEIVPEYLIDDGEVSVYTGVDGKVYLRDYVDNYPVTRPRVAEDGEIVDSWVADYLAHGGRASTMEG